MTGPSAISVIIPCFHDLEALREALDAIGRFPVVPEIVVVDASGGDEGERIRAVAGNAGARYIEAAFPNRGAQLNQGARAATGGILVFHHADTGLTPAHLGALDRAMAERPELAGGAFYKDIAAHYPCVSWAVGLYRLYARRIGILYGDQSCFVRRAFFDEIGGFRDIPLMEDVAMSATLRRSRRIVLLDPPIRTSMRKFQREGIFLRKIQNVLLVLLFRLGVSPHRLYRWYYRTRNRAAPR